MSVLGVASTTVGAECCLAVTLMLRVCYGLAPSQSPPQTGGEDFRGNLSWWPVGPRHNRRKKGADAWGVACRPLWIPAFAGMTGWRTERLFSRQ